VIDLYNGLNNSLAFGLRHLSSMAETYILCQASQELQLCTQHSTFSTTPQRLTVPSPCTAMPGVYTLTRRRTSSLDLLLLPSGVPAGSSSTRPTL
jgi:hypothetical protein